MINNFNLFLANKIGAFSILEIFANIVTEWYYYLVLFGIIGLVVLLCVLYPPKHTVKLEGSKKIAVTAMLVALAFIANVGASGPDLWKFSFVPTVSFIAGLVLGPGGGFTVGFLGDLIAGIIAPQGPYNPIIAIASSLWGFIPGVIFGYFRKHFILNTVISYVIGFIVCSLFLNTSATYFMYSSISTKYPTLISYVSYRIIPTLITAFVINTPLSILLYPIINKIFPRKNN
ncbi:MAG: folate family ECF transporter S component [Clostridia bacterium]|nr:folate family ECF transporter S component [Clostridia bacterium]MBQ4586177.1 folate family ECF transporter S component [Clostridia bacterium]